MSNNVGDLLDVIEARLTAIAVYSERQAIAIEALLELTKTKKEKAELRSQPSRFKPPTVLEVTDYIKEVKAGIDANGFIDYYTARGWKLTGGDPVKDWKACVRTWSRNGFSKKPVQDNDRTGAVL